MSSSHASSPLAVNVVWPLLLGLTLLSYFLAEKGWAPGLTTPFVLASATLKAWLIGAVFMELRQGHKGILIVFGLFFASLCLLLAWVLNS